MSEAIREIDGSDYDHVGLLAYIDDNGTIVLDDIGFAGHRRYALRDYDDRPEAILVRRHRHPDATKNIEPLIEKFGVERPGYAWDRLGHLIVLSLTRYMPRLATYPPERAASFLERMHLLFTLSAESATRTDTAVCVDLIEYLFDRYATDDIDAPYFGLVLPRYNAGGLLAWANSAMRFSEFLHGPQTTTAISEPLSDGALHRIEWFLYRELGVSLPLPTVTTDDSLREQVQQSGLAFARLLGITDCDPSGRPFLPSVMLMYLMDRILRDRFIVSPRDYCLSKSFFDVGYLDLTDLDWAKARTVV